MKLLIVYDSVFGNTAQLARAMGKSFKQEEDVVTLQANELDIEHIENPDVLIVGSPTHGFRPSEAIKKLLKEIPKDKLKGVGVAAFDTRLSLSEIDSSILRFIVKTGGYAARSITKKLTAKGGSLIVPSEGFLVMGEKGPLKEGELERAAAWIQQILVTKQQ